MTSNPDQLISMAYKKKNYLEVMRSVNCCKTMLPQLDISSRDLFLFPKLKRTIKTHGFANTSFTGNSAGTYI